MSQAWVAAVLVLALGMPALAPAAGAASSHADANVAYLLGALQAEAQRHGQSIPDLAGYEAGGLVTDTAQGTQVRVQVPAMDALRQVAQALGDVDLAQLAARGGGQAAGGVGVGDNVHGYASLRWFDCSFHSYYTISFSTAPLAVPHENLPPVPPMFSKPTIWGGPVVLATGGGWLVGGHLFLGTPFDVNVHTGGGAPLSMGLAADFDGSIDTVAAGKIAAFSTPIEIWGFCILSIDFGYILENGELQPTS